MSLGTIVQLLPRTSLVDTHHGDTNRPRCLADTETEVAVVCVNVSSLLQGLHDLDDGGEERVLEIS